MNAFWVHCLPYLDVDCPGFEVETQINVRLARSPLRVVEVPSYEHNRVHGVSNLNAVTDGVRVLRVILRERFANLSHAGSFSGLATPSVSAVVLTSAHAPSTKETVTSLRCVDQSSRARRRGHRGRRPNNSSHFRRGTWLIDCQRWGWLRHQSSHGRPTAVHGIRAARFEATWLLNADAQQPNTGNPAAAERLLTGTGSNGVGGPGQLERRFGCSARAAPRVSCAVSPPTAPVTAAVAAS